MYSLFLSWYWCLEMMEKGDREVMCRVRQLFFGNEVNLGCGKV